jgi:hypothetical protein
MSDADLSRNLEECPACGRLVNLDVVWDACPDCEHPIDGMGWSL